MRPIGFWALLAIVFLTVSGGAYGLEPLVASVGGTRALVLLLLVPVIWSLPVAVMAAELSSRMPLLGGYYEWVRQTMGEFWGFQEGWWSWLFTWVDMPLYPALAGEILRTSWPLLTGHGLSSAHTLGFVVGFLWLGVLVNYTGTKVVAEYSIICTVAVLLPFVVFVLAAWHRTVTGVGLGSGSAPTAGWALGLSTVMWNYAGWDNVSTFAPSVSRPQRTYPKALLVGIVLIAVCYIAPVAAGLRMDAVSAHWQDGYFVTLGARALGGKLALIMALTAVASAWAQFTAQLLYVLPLPVALAEQGYLPAGLARVNGRGVAGRALLVCAGVYTVFALAAFSRLVVADVLLYSSGLGLEFLALLLVRRRAGGGKVGEARAGFRIPLSGWGLVGMCAMPMGLAAVVLGYAIEQERLFTLIALGMLASGPVLYGLRSGGRGRRLVPMALAGGPDRGTRCDRRDSDR